MTEVVGHDPGRKPCDRGNAPKGGGPINPDGRSCQYGPRRVPPKPKGSRAGSRNNQPSKSAEARKAQPLEARPKMDQGKRRQDPERVRCSRPKMSPDRSPDSKHAEALMA